MPILSRRFGRKLRRARSSPPNRDRDWVSLRAPRATASTPFEQFATDDTPPRSPSPPLSEPPAPYDTPARSSPQLEDVWTVLGTRVRADISPHDEAFNPDMNSPNDMMIDTEEHIVEPTENGAEKDNLTIINPDNLDTEAEQPQDLPRADDCKEESVLGREKQ